MSSTSSVQLTEEQEKFLSELEEEFKDRYTLNDEEFKAVLNTKLPPPPVVENWGNFRQRNERSDYYRHNRNRDYREHREHRDESSRGFPYDRRRDRYYDEDGYSHSSRQDYRYRMRN